MKIRIKRDIEKGYINPKIILKFRYKTEKYFCSLEYRTSKENVYYSQLINTSSTSRKFSTLTLLEWKVGVSHGVINLCTSFGPYTYFLTDKWT